MTEQERFEKVQRMICKINGYDLPETDARVTDDSPQQPLPSREPNLTLIDSYVARRFGDDH